ncbi:vacuolar protein sorting-associated protein 51 homolog isoform X2 [Acipenser ruthenus]|uniref:vacuolar protein sorting-associated protein 51 homolog isoform X2 n=1 Tax=Acipenser ruthenus TaxID=7906 RepID=UPI0027407CDD|nr:vacuolar protein sorting-associated protein 51 homolog isoform X2 [Acipenser ruthenus]
MSAVTDPDPDPDSPGSDPARKRRAHGMLKLYYGINEEGKPGEKRDPLDPCDINGARFEPEVYLNKLRKDSSLAELMDQETGMVKQIRSLDSDMQTLVYENYNKFISATDTIRKMKNDFKKMEDEMDCLAANMAAITEFSARISGTLQGQHQQITKLSGVHTLLRKLQFLFELPSRLNQCVAMEAFPQAVTYYTKARSVLHQYQNMPSFQGIQNDCQNIMAQLAQKLREKFSDGVSSSSELSECVELLLRLDEPAEELCDKFLSHAQSRLEEELAGLEAELGAGSHQQAPPTASTSSTDILEFIDKGCNNFVSSLCLVIASYQELFITSVPGTSVSSRLQDGELASRDVPRMASSKLVEFVDRLCGRYFSVVELRIREEKGVGDNSLLVRALDRFHRRLQAVSKVLPGSGVPARGTEIVVGAARGRVRQYLAGLKSFYLDSLTDVRQALSAPRLPGKEAPSLAEVLGGLSSAVLNQVKSVLAYVHLFTAKDVSFASKPYFKGEFCSQGVREGLVVSFIQFICQSSQQFCESVGEKGAPSTPPSLLLLLSRLCLDYESSTISYILTLADEQFLGQDQSPLTPVSVLCAQAREVAQRLLNHYVKLQGLIVSLSLLPQDQSPLTPVSVLCAQAREVAQRLLNHYVKLQGLIVSLSLLPQDQSPLTPVSVLCAQAREVAQRLLNHYVKLQGLIVSLSLLPQDQSPLTPVSVLCAQAREVAQRLLNHYVKLQGLIVSLSLLPQDQSPLTPVSVLCAQAREVAQRLLNHYVKLQGLIVSLSLLPQDQSPLTPVSVLCAQAREVAQRLLNHYVKLQGLIVSLSLSSPRTSPPSPRCQCCVLRLGRWLSGSSITM